MKKPYWLDKKIEFRNLEIKRILAHLNLYTVCEEAKCPNISDCFKKGVATFMILGNICTRNCSFCAVNKGKPKPVDYSELDRLILAVKELKLNYVVITSPTRDDLANGGAEFFYEAVNRLKNTYPRLTVELLIPDFLGDINSLKIVTKSKADIIGHNLETVKSLYPKVRPDSNYYRSLEVLRKIKLLNSNILTKSALILGLGETESEVLEAFKDLKETGCSWLILGQYLAPSLKHYPVKEYLPKEKFLYFKQKALEIGFNRVTSFPYARSSYREF